MNYPIGTIIKEELRNSQEYGIVISEPLLRSGGVFQRIFWFSNESTGILSEMWLNTICKKVS